MMSSSHLVDLFDDFTVICHQYITLGYCKYNLCLYLSKCVRKKDISSFAGYRDEVHIICACAYLLNNNIRDIDFPNMLDLCTI